MFLLGSRQARKSILLRHQFPNVRCVDLLEAETFKELSAHPKTLRQRLRPDEKIVIIDEIQKLPHLLDEVQLLIDQNKSLRFIITGSNARKLKRGAANFGWSRVGSDAGVPSRTVRDYFQIFSDTLMAHILLPLIVQSPLISIILGNSLSYSID